MARESDIRTRIVKEIKRRGGRPIKYHGSCYSEAGVPDLLVCYKGFFVFIETKKPGEQPTPKQVAVIQELERSRGTGGIAESVEDAMSILDRIDERVSRLLDVAECLVMEADGMGCDRGNPNGGGDECAHCMYLGMAATIKQEVDW